MSSEITYTLEPTDLEWEMDWSQTKPDGSRQYPDKPEKEMVFEKDKAVAHLIMNEVIFLNNHWWKKEWPEDAKKSTALNINCSDVFAWGCADAEEITTKEIEVLYRMWKDNPGWGSALWCIMKRREMPQDPVAEAMRKDGVDLDAFQKKHNVRENFSNGFCRAIKEAGVKHGDEMYAEARAKFIKENGWEGDAE